MAGRYRVAGTSRQKSRMNSLIQVPESSALPGSEVVCRIRDLCIPTVVLRQTACSLGLIASCGKVALEQKDGRENPAGEKNE